MVRSQVRVGMPLLYVGRYCLMERRSHSYEQARWEAGTLEGRGVGLEVQTSTPAIPPIGSDSGPEIKSGLAKIACQSFDFA